eukprot:895544-Amorphochlora_amoeboformis.AAC.1
MNDDPRGGRAGDGRKTDDLKKLIARHTKMEIELIEIIDYGNLVIMTAALGGLMALIYYRGEFWGILGVVME